MQKVLLATTALAMTTGWAMADVTNAGNDAGATITLDGYAAMGIIGQGFDGSDDSKSDSFATDIDLTFIMVGQTDGGLEFGAEIDLDEAEDDSGSGDLDFEEPDDQGGEVIYIKGAFGTLTMGDTDGALDWAMSEAIIGSAIGDVNEHAGYNGNAGLDGIYDGQVARYEYAFGDFAVAFSGEIDDSGDAEPALGLGGKYTLMYGGMEMAFGAGVQVTNGLDPEDFFDTATGDDEDFDALIWGVSGELAMANGIQFIASYQKADDGAEESTDGQHYGLAVGYETGPLLVAVNYGHYDDWGVVDTDAEGYGLTANYDLGGGASLQGAYAHNVVNANDFATYSFGVAMDF